MLIMLAACTVLAGSLQACPEWFKRKMPAGCVLDGELWGGRGQFQKTAELSGTGRRRDAKNEDPPTFWIFGGKAPKGLGNA